MTDVERFLNRYCLLCMQQKQAQNELLEAKAAYEWQVDKFLKPASYEDTRVQTSGNKDPVADAVIKMVDVYAKTIDEAGALVARLEKEKQHIATVVRGAQLNPMEYSYIAYRFFKGLQAKQTALKMKYSESHVKRFRQSALAKISAALKAKAGDESANRE